MNTRFHQAMKRVSLIASAIALLAFTLSSCMHPGAEKMRATCGFSDPATAASLGICNLAAEYYVAHREWPLSKALLEEQNRKLVAREGAKMSKEERAELGGFMNRFTQVDLRKSGDDLVMHYRFKNGRATMRQTVKLRPRPTVDEILEASAEE